MPTSTGPRLYVDTNVFIYFAERHATFGPVSLEQFQAAHEDRCGLVTSELTLAEALVLPFKLDKSALQSLFMEAIRPSRNLEVVSVSREILASRSNGGETSRCHTCGAAIASGCSAYISDDKGIRSPEGLQTVTLSNFSTMLP